jgi:hypothetical protein
MATVVQEGKVFVKGRFDSLQVAQDTEDIELAVPADVTHMEIHSFNPDQTIWYSLTGAVNTWLPLAPPSRFGSSGPIRVFLEGETKVYLRKTYKPRYISFWPGISGKYMGKFDATAGIPALVDGVGNDKEFYYVNVAGTYDFGGGNITFAVGEWVIYDGAAGTWGKATDDPRKGLADDRIVMLNFTFTAD